MFQINAAQIKTGIENLTFQDFYFLEFSSGRYGRNGARGTIKYYNLAGILHNIGLLLRFAPKGKILKQTPSAYQIVIALFGFRRVLSNI